MTLLPEQIRGLRKEFEKADVEGSKKIALDELQRVLSISSCLDFDAMQTLDGGRVQWHEFLATGLSDGRSVSAFDI